MLTGDPFRSKAKKEWAMDTRVGIEKQIKVRNDGNQALVAEFKYDEGNTKAIERDLTSLNMIEKSEKKARQLKYKEMLDSQSRIKHNMNMYGNMTGVEKQINKNDLSAFKNYDNKTYALIPGMNSKYQSPSKKVLADKMNRTAHQDQNNSLNEIDYRMNQFGLTKDATLVKNPALNNNAHRSSVDNISGHVFKHSLSQRADGSPQRTLPSSPKAGSGPEMPFTSDNVNLNSINNFNNHHLYQSYNPITGAYSAEKQELNQKRTTFRFAAAKNVLN